MGGEGWVRCRPGLGQRSRTQVEGSGVQGVQV